MWAAVRSLGGETGRLVRHGRLGDCRTSPLEARDRSRTFAGRPGAPPSGCLLPRTPGAAHGHGRRTNRRSPELDRNGSLPEHRPTPDPDPVFPKGNDARACRCRWNANCSPARSVGGTTGHCAAAALADRRRCVTSGVLGPEPNGRGTQTLAWIDIARSGERSTTARRPFGYDQVLAVTPVIRRETALAAWVWFFVIDETGESCQSPQELQAGRCRHPRHEAGGGSLLRRSCCSSQSARCTRGVFSVLRLRVRRRWDCPIPKHLCLSRSRSE